MAGEIRKEIQPGMTVAIVLKKDQRTGTLTEGYVKDLLTSAPKHHRGIKVRLEDGQIGLRLEDQRVVGQFAGAVAEGGQHMDLDVLGGLAGEEEVRHGAAHEAGVERLQPALRAELDPASAHGFGDAVVVGEQPASEPVETT